MVRLLGRRLRVNKLAGLPLELVDLLGVPAQLVVDKVKRLFVFVYRRREFLRAAAEHHTFSLLHNLLNLANQTLNALLSQSAIGLKGDAARFNRRSRMADPVHETFKSGNRCQL